MVLLELTSQICQPRLVSLANIFANERYRPDVTQVTVTALNLTQFCCISFLARSWALYMLEGLLLLWQFLSCCFYTIATLNVAWQLAGWA